MKTWKEGSDEDLRCMHFDKEDRHTYLLTYLLIVVDSHWRKLTNSSLIDIDVSRWFMPWLHVK